MSTRRTYGILAGIVAFVPFAVSAQSAADVQAQIAQLTQLIAVLQAQIQAAQTSGGSTVPTTTPSPTSVVPCLNLSVDLKERYFDIDGPGPITKLQSFLASTGDFTHEITGYYGAITTSAVQSFQRREGIASSGTPDTTGYGAVGPRTRAVIKAMTCSNTQTTVPPTTTYVPPSGTYVPPVTTTPIPVATQRSCALGSFYIPSGTSVRAYSRLSVGPTESCESYAQTRVCTDGVLSGNSLNAYGSCRVDTSGCVIGGIGMANGESRTFYSVGSATTGTCSNYAQVRTCTNGVLTGAVNYAYAGCQDTGPRSCSLDGVTADNGVSRTFYMQRTAPYGSTCSAYGYARPCIDGSFTGPSNYEFASCTVATTSSCTLDGVTVANGANRTFYSNTSVSSGSCTAIASTRTCSNGILNGSDSYSHASCLDSVSSCTFNGTTLANGATVTAYLAEHVASTDSCSYYTATRTCVNGTLSGNTAYKYASCAKAAAGQCVLDSKVMNSGTTKTFYSATSPAAGSLCGSIGVSRTCTNGSLSGSATYKYASCNDTASCTLDGVPVANGSSATFYSASSVAYGSTCTAVSQNRTCTNGKLSGSTTYQYGTCSVNPPVTLGEYSTQLASVASILEAILGALGGSN